MPWCEACDAMVEDEDLADDGTCPECGEHLAGSRHVPWHLKLLIAATVVYLGWRSYQGITWLVHHG